MSTSSETKTTRISAEAEYLAELYRSWNARLNGNEFDVATQRNIFDEWHLATVEPQDVTYEEVDAGGVPAIWAKPLEAESDRVIVFFHGGGGVVGSAHTHRKLAAHIAKASNAYALILNYRLAPEHPFPAQVEDGIAVFDWLYSEGYKPEKICSMGDSAGGGFAISTVIKLRDEGKHLPAAIVAMSPYTDMELSGAAMEENRDTEALVDRPLMEQMVQGLLVGQTPVTDPLANLLYADMKGLPPVYISAGQLEMLRDDGTRLAQKIEEAGGDVLLEIGEDMQHVYQFLAGRAPEGDAAVQHLANWLRPHLGL